MTIDLKPCSFCGSIELVETKDDVYICIVCVYCKSCGAVGPYGLFTPANIRWNTRANADVFLGVQNDQAD